MKDKAVVFAENLELQTSTKFRNFKIKITDPVRLTLKVPEIKMFTHEEFKVAPSTDKQTYNAGMVIFFQCHGMNEELKIKSKLVCSKSLAPFQS